MKKWIIVFFLFALVVVAVGAISQLYSSHLSTRVFLLF